MNWLFEMLHNGSSSGSLLVLALVAAVGLALGSVRVRGLGLGIAGVLFSGIVAGHVRLKVGLEVLDFTRDFGLVLFVYCIGVQVGPGFRASLRRSGLPLNLLAAGLVLSGAVLAVLIGLYMHVPIPVAVGLFSGGTTNTPSLGAAQMALADLPWYTQAMGSQPGLGYAVSYPFGILGVIFTMIVMRGLFRTPASAAPIPAEAAEATQDFEAAEPHGSDQTSVQVLSMFLGIALGLLLGSIPFPVRGLPAPLRLGLTTGPMMMAIILASVPRVGPLTWRMPEKANLMLREVGIVLFLASAGVRAGDQFVATLVRGDGLYWMANAAAITLLPSLGLMLVARYLFGLRYHFTCGLLAGSMTDPPALAFASAQAKTRDPVVAYATVYPLTQLLRALSAQLIVLLFVRP